MHVLLIQLWYLNRRAHHAPHSRFQQLMLFSSEAWKQVFQWNDCGRGLYIASTNTAQHQRKSEDDASAGLDRHTLFGAKLRTGVAALAAKEDDTVIDVGGRDSTTQRAALAIADVYLVPFAPRSPDLWTCNLVDELVKEAKGVNLKLQAYSFVSRADQYGLAGAAGQLATSILSSLEHLDFLPLVIGNRVAFEKAFSQGLSVLELQPAKANAEVTALFTHIQTLANEKPEPKLLPSMRKVNTFVNAGGEVAAEKTDRPTSDKFIVSYTLRVYSSKLGELAAVRDARKAEKLAEGKPDRNTISVHSLLLEAIDSFLKQEAKRAVKKAAIKSVNR